MPFEHIVDDGSKRRSLKATSSLFWELWSGLASYATLSSSPASFFTLPSSGLSIFNCSAG